MNILEIKKYYGTSDTAATCIGCGIMTGRKGNGTIYLLQKQEGGKR